MRPQFEIGAPPTSGTVEGIGIKLAPSAAGWTVGRLHEGPARRAGLRRGDLIVEVDGVDVTRHSFVSANELIRGPAGSQVRLSLLRGDQWLEIPIQRAVVVFPVEW